MQTLSESLAPRRLAHARDIVAAGWMSRDEAIMGTAIHVQLWCEDRRAGNAALAAVMAEMHRIDAAMSPHKAASELSRINRDAAREAVPLSEEMFALVARAIGYSQLSGGAFDITYASVGQLFDYRRGIRPSDAEIELARPGIGWQHLQLDAGRRTLRFAHPRTRVDLGGFAKGHAVENSAAILARHGIAHAIVSAGGDSRIVGDHCGRPWTIAVRDPRRADAVVALLPLEDTAVSTSGDYERFFEEGGVRYHHLIDPRSARSPAGLRSVTILAPDGSSAEAMSKSVFVLGLEAGLRLVESQPGIDAVVVDAKGALHYSSGLLQSSAGAGVRQ